MANTATVGQKRGLGLSVLACPLELPRFTPVSAVDFVWPCVSQSVQLEWLWLVVSLLC